MIDTHCHLTYSGLREQVCEVINRARIAGVDRMISVGTTPDDAQQAIKTAEQFEGVYATVGVHPHYASDWTDQSRITDAILEISQHPKVVAIGEMGLDKHYPDPPLDQQRSLLAWQLEAVQQLHDLPVIIHNREATDEVLYLLRQSGIPGHRFVFHCFTGNASELDAILAFGAMVSFTGIITFNSAIELAKASDRVPIDRLMIETDSPYLTPVPYRKIRPNEPQYVIHVAQFIAQRRDLSVDNFTQQTDLNADHFFAFSFNSP